MSMTHNPMLGYATPRADGVEPASELRRALINIANGLGILTTAFIAMCAWRHLASPSRTHGITLYVAGWTGIAFIGVIVNLTVGIALFRSRVVGSIIHQIWFRFIAPGCFLLSLAIVLLSELLEE